ncbi:1,4-alpha-glucan branching enzyme [subsurface metagenome]
MESKKTIGSFSFIFHSHLPYVRKAGVWPFGEEWLHEALSETYIPLLDVFYNLIEEGEKPKATIGITPVLAEQLNDPYLSERFQKYMEIKIEECEEDIKRNASNPKLRDLAIFYKGFFNEIISSYIDRYNYDVIGAFRKLQDEGFIEIITCAATHGYLPLLGRDSAINAQIKVGVESYKRLFGREPKGIWLPECAYRHGYEWISPVEGEYAQKGFRPGIEKFLIENKIKYFIVDTHTIEGGKTMGVYALRFPVLQKLYQQSVREYKEIKVDEPKTTFSPYLLKYNDDFIAIVGRNEKAGLQVWSGEWGYPGDGWYREFHKKDSISGLQYWRVTGSDVDLGSKALYEPNMVMTRVEENSDHFVHMVYSLLKDYKKQTGKNGIVAAPYDSELFGHWWFEGPKWIKQILKTIGKIEELDMTTISEYLEKFVPEVTIRIPESSWGEGGHHWVWLNKDTYWIWPHIYESEKKMEDLAKKYRKTDDDFIKRVLNQAARELLLLESSDWPFLITTWQARDYASNRFSEHLDSFRNLVDAVEQGRKDKEFRKYLETIEEKDKIFPNIDFTIYAKY